MSFKLFESLMNLMEYGNEVFPGDVDHPPVKPTDIQSENGELDVYNDKTLVITYTANYKVWGPSKRGDESSVHGLNSLDVKAFLVHGKVLFAGPTLPSDELQKWNGNPRTVHDLHEGAEWLRGQFAEEGHQDLVALYDALVQEKPNVWKDVETALLSEYKELNNLEH